MKKEATAVINMAKYDESEEIHEKCVGCKKVFEHTFISEEDEIAIVIAKCLTYCRPAMWWEEKPIATKKVLVKDKDHPRGQLVDVPVREFRCPVATHVSVAAAADKAKVNPLKAAKRASQGN